MINNSFKKIKFEFETGILKESDMSEYEKQSLIEFYKKENEQLSEKIEEIEKVLYKKYMDMKKSRI